VNKLFYIFGDSVCFGQYIPSHLTWVNMLSKLVFREEFNKLILQNPSRNGNTTIQALERLDYDILSNKPKFCLVQFGLNDCNIWQQHQGNRRVSPKDFENNLIEIINKIYDAGAQFIFLNTNHPTLKKFSFETKITYEESNKEYNEIIRNVSKKFSNSVIQLTDIEKAMNAEFSASSIQKTLLQDGIHLSALGHEVYFKEIKKSIQRIKG